MNTTSTNTADMNEHYSNALTTVDKVPELLVHHRHTPLWGTSSLLLFSKEDKQYHVEFLLKHNYSTDKSTPAYNV